MAKRKNNGTDLNETDDFEMSNDNMDDILGSDEEEISNIYNRSTAVGMIEPDKIFDKAENSSLEDEEEDDVEDEGEAEKLESEPETTRFARPVSKKRYVEEDDDEDWDDVDEDDDEEPLFFEVTCPACEKTITVDEDVLNLGSIQCPNCGEMMEFEFDEDDEAPED